MYASVSRLDSFALLRSTDWMDVERYVAQVKEPFRSTPEMDAGKEVHNFAEQRPVTEEQIETKYGIDWDVPNVVETINQIPVDTAVEIPGSVVINTGRWGELFIPGRADGLTGLQCRDVKTTFKSFKVENYPDAYQWRFYLMMFGCKRFVYDLITIRKDRRSGLHRLKREDPVVMYGYPGLEDDCRALVVDFMATMERLNLLDYLLTKTEKANVANTAKKSG